MKKRLFIFIASLLAVPVLTVGMVSAQRIDRVLPPQSCQTTTSSGTSSCPPEVNKIKLRCVVAQTRLKLLAVRITTVKTTRTQLYNNLIDKLTALSTKLQTAGLDVTTLNTQITALQSKVTTFNTNLTNYKQAVADLATMDCKSDPTAFKASLETARSLRLTLFTSGQEIRTYLKETIRPTLQTLKTQLEAKSSSPSQ